MQVTPLRNRRVTDSCKQGGKAGRAARRSAAKQKVGSRLGRGSSATRAPLTLHPLVLGLPRAGVAVHGTQWHALNTQAQQQLSRQAPALPAEPTQILPGHRLVAPLQQAAAESRHVASRHHTVTRPPLRATGGRATMSTRLGPAR